MFSYCNHWWPDGIKSTSPEHALKRRNNAFAAMARYFPNASERRVVVTAGGMTGLWSLEYLTWGFQTVYTFEPAPHVWPCLERNCAEQITDGRIMARNVALGASHGLSGVVVKEVGSSFIDSGAGALTTIIPLDSLALSRCDWLQFDLEGYEYPALLGAAQTIARHKPKIQLELNGVGNKRYMFGEVEVRQFLDNHGYVEAARIPGSDVIFTHRGGK